MAEESLRFGSGRGAPRSEDDPLLAGRGRFTDDVNLPGQAYAAFVRAQLAHARIRAVDVSRAAHMPGVLGVHTGEELARAAAPKNGVTP